MFESVCVDIVGSSQAILSMSWMAEFYESQARASAKSNEEICRRAEKAPAASRSNRAAHDFELRRARELEAHVAELSSREEEHLREISNLRGKLAKNMEKGLVFDASVLHEEYDSVVLENQSLRVQLDEAMR